MKISMKVIQPVVLGLVLIGLVILALSGYLAPVIRATTTPIVGIQSWLASRYLAIQSILDTPEDLVILRQQNFFLESEISRLQAEIIELKQQVADTRILEALVDFARESNPENRYKAADVIGKDTSPYMQYIIINRGSDDGLRRGMPVVTQQGLVGRIAAVLPNAARVQLITDTASALNVNVEPSGAPGVLQGQITGNIVIDLIPKTASVNPGDLVLSSGLGGNYPSDLIVGQVTTVRSRENDLFQRATVQSPVDFDNLDMVLIIINFRPVDISPLIPTPVTP
jgi:rod shape-determining protein MreC